MKHLPIVLAALGLGACILDPGASDGSTSQTTNDSGATTADTGGSTGGSTGDDGSSGETAADESSGGPVDGSSGDESTTGGDALPSAAAIDLAVGRLHSCALTDDGAVRCWGYSDLGQLGNGAPFDDVAFRVPVAVEGLDGVIAIASFFDHTCARTAEEVLCWGSNDHGQLGDGSTNGSAVPVAVVGGDGFTAISAGVAHTCAITASGGLLCWGHNDYGQLGDGTTDDATTPVDVMGIGGAVIAVSAGRDHTCAVTDDGALHCWGGDTYGELGDGEPLAASSTPVTVTGIGASVVDVAAGDNDTCAITTAGAAWCWGKNADGQVGNGDSGTQVMTSTPAAVVGLDAGVTAIAPGYGYTCAVVAGAMLCWGDNFDGTLGNGEGPGFESPVPIGVMGQTEGGAQIGTCSAHACGRTDAGAVWCWGGNDGGELGDGSQRSSTVPVQVVSLP